MSTDQEFNAKTFDQQLLLVRGDIAAHDIVPNKQVPGEIVFEPLATGVRVTARDAQHRILWGYVGSEEKLKQTHCLVAVYNTLQTILSEQLIKNGSCKREVADPIAAAQNALDRLERTVKWLRDSLDVKKISEATADRAKTIAQIVSDADQQITLEAGTLKGMRSKSD